MNSKKSYLFLLGGYDLEMVEIKELLQKLDISYLDAALSWNNATWEAYEQPSFQDQINTALTNGYQIVGIELRGAQPEGPHYQNLDHHNNQQGKNSALEQVAQILDLPLSRRQQLVAANDRGHIPAMQALCASKEEAEEIRAVDRLSQGATEKDEELALESIQDHQTKEGKVVIVKSLTPYFSTIADRLFDKTDRLLIYNDKTLTYYGIDKGQLVDKFDHLLKNNKAYHGGGELGYFGLNDGSFLPEEIQAEVNMITTTINAENVPRLFSSHTFLFPFKWQHAKNDLWENLGSKFDLKKFREFDLPNWKRKPYALNAREQYNEYNYFYAHVREILYDLDESLLTGNSIENEDLVNHFEYQLDSEKPLYYCIQLADGKVFRLQIDSILLNIYGTGTGVLSFHLRNSEHPHPNDILRINQFGRRLFPPFFGLNNQAVISQESPEMGPRTALNQVKDSELPESIFLSYGHNGPLSHLFEDFSSYLDPESFKHGPFRLPAFITGLFPKNFLFCHEKEVKEARAYKVYIRPTLDDRMFTLCWYDHPELSRQQTAFDEQKGDYAYEHNEWWYKYLFLDVGFPTNQHRTLRQQQLKEHTYGRWVDFGTLIGISPYSMVMLTGGLPVDLYHLVRHFQSMYYKMAELCLVQRATVLSFADEVTHVSYLAKKGKGKRENGPLTQISDLYKHYILFINKIYFREITAQEQGIELYALLQRTLHLKDDVKDLGKEIQELHNYASLEFEKQNNSTLNRLSIVGALFLPFSLLAGILGMNTLPDSANQTLFTAFTPYGPFWVSIGVVLVLSVLMIGGLYFLLKISEGLTRNRQVWLWVGLVSILLIGIALITFGSLVWT